MKKDTRTILLIILIFVAIILTLIFVNKYREKHVNSYVFPETINVNNYTDNFRADTVAMIITHLILNYDTINIDIFEMRGDISNDNYDIVGFIQKTEKPHTYQIFLKKTTKSYINRFLSHELIHLDQMERGDLIQEIGNTKHIIYKGDTIYYKESPYEERQYEIDAFSRERRIEKKLRELLYKK